MQFKRLRLSGFKSFVEPAELRIEPGLTGVVGPNGCGKSNLLEAIRWVMGENSARQMRGGGMDDVIFAGTTRRPARDFAEVTLSVEADPPGAYGADLEIVRRIERGAGSVYRINGRDVRARDIALVFADAATGAHSPALVSQGRIAAVIAAKPADRRAMLEEAAGIAGLHVRRREAETRLRATETNLGRLDDLLTGLEARMASLSRQARAAERYRTISERIRVAEARLVFARWREAAEAADSAHAKAREAEAGVHAAQAAASAAEKDQHEATAALASEREALWALRQDSATHGERLTSLVAQHEAAAARLADCDRQIARLERDAEDSRRIVTEAGAARNRLEGECAKAQATLAEEENRRPEARLARDRAETEARNAEIDLATATAEQASNEAEWRIAEAAVGAARQGLARIDAEAARLAATAQALAREPDPALALAAAQERREAASAALALARTTREDLAARVEALGAEREAAALALSTARADLAGLSREAEALQRDKTARDKAAAARGRGPGALGGSRAAPGYERALAAVLGRDASAPVGPIPPAGAANGRFWTGATPPAPLPDALAHHVPRAPKELAARLALVRFAETDEGQSLGPGEWLVTRAGHLRRWDGFVARGEGAAEAAQLEAENRLAELEAQLPPLRAAAAEAETAHQAASESLASARTALVAADRALVSAAEAERTALRSVDSAEAAQRARAGREADLARTQADCASQRDKAAQELAEAVSRQSALPDPTIGRARLEAARARNEAARGALLRASAALSASDQALALGRERLASLTGDLRNWQSRASDAETRLAGFAARAAELAEDHAVLAARPASFATQIDEARATGAGLAEKLAADEAALTVAERAASAAERALASAVSDLGALREARAGLAAKAASEEQRRQEMAGISGERFHCPPPLLPSRIGFEASSVGAAASESAAHDKLVAERERIGPVNLVAADELAEAEATHGTTIAERAELTEAVNRLRGSIGSLNREGRERLRAAFEAVDGHFRRLFTRLFGGGEAHLALVDSDDPLEAGLEIFAQPPGKRLQSLTLLSGGEQALTALALIFALFLTNPSPICVLDEVDAPLDDANVDRFCDMLDAMVQDTRTRYLIVTHNGVTMSRMHRLFGVTMVEKGVSRLVSVDLGAAEALLTQDV